jgi:hypothetical protein
MKMIKTVIDWHYCLVRWKKGTVANALLSTCYSRVEENVDLVNTIFQRLMTSFDASQSASMPLAIAQSPQTRVSWLRSPPSQ